MVKAKIMTVTPELAKKWLEKNGVNRDIRTKKVELYARDMLRGAWQTNGECIVFGEDGALKDGQHRLSAVVKANIPVAFLVVTGVENDVNLFDRGASRSVTDMLRLSGMEAKIANNSTVSMTKMHFLFQFGISQITDAECKAYLERHQENIIKADSIRKRLGNSNKLGFKMGSPVTLAFFYAYELGIDFEKLDRFTQIMVTGLPEGKSEYAAVVFRNDLIKQDIAFKYNSERIKAVYQTEKAIDDFIRGYPRRLSYKSISEPTFSNNVLLKQK